MKNSRDKIVVYALLVILSIINLATIFVILANQNRLKEELSNSINSSFDTRYRDPKDGSDGKDGRDGYTPIKGIDYFDGISIKGDQGDRGEQGDSIKGDKGDTGDKGSDGKDGFTPQLRCNTEKNRWEVRYTDDSKWELLNNERVKCTTGGGL